MQNTNTCTPSRKHTSIVCSGTRSSRGAILRAHLVNNEIPKLNTHLDQLGHVVLVVDEVEDVDAGSTLLETL